MWPERRASWFRTNVTRRHRGREDPHGALGIRVEVADRSRGSPDGRGLAAVLAQYPDTTGVLHDFADLARETHEPARCSSSVPICSLHLLRPPGRVRRRHLRGRSQRFGVPLGSAGLTRPSWPVKMNSQAQNAWRSSWASPKMPPAVLRLSFEPANARAACIRREKPPATSAPLRSSRRHGLDVCGLSRP